MHIQKRWDRTDRILKAAAILFFILAVSFFHSGTAKAAENVTIKEINYSDSTITLQAGNSDTAVFFSDSRKKNWEEVPGELSSAGTVTMDISWVPVSKNYIITFKGNKSAGIATLVLPKQISNFRAEFNNIKNTVIFKNQGIHTIEWRKKDSSVWNAINTTQLSTQLSYLYDNGAAIIFRLAPRNGTGTTNVGFRGSKEISVKIPKKPSAPNIKINGSKFSIPVKKGMAYRIAGSDGQTSNWISITGSSDLLLKNVAANALYNASADRSAVIMQFRTNATGSTQVSKISTVTIPVQEGPPGLNTYGILLKLTSSSTITLEVKAASTENPFEYTVVLKDMELNYQNAKWTTISNSTPVTLDDDTAPAGCHIFIRKKSVEETKNSDFRLASVEAEVTGTSGLAFPDAPKPASLTTLVSTAGVCQTSNSASYLTFQLYSPTSTTVSSIKFKNAYGTDKGAVTCKSSVAANPASTGTNDKYIITTKITSTGDIDRVTGEKLYAVITLADTDVITSTDTSGILLYLYPGSRVDNPTDNDAFTSDFKRVYMSNASEDNKNFKFKLDFGSVKIPDRSLLGSFTSENVAISSIAYEGYTLNKDTDYTVEYGSYVNNDDITIATATVTVNAANFEKASAINKTNQAYPLVITLNNGEVLNDDINITLVNTATIDNIPFAVSITQGSLPETTTKTTTNSDGTTTKVTEDVVSYTISLTLFDKNYSVGVSDVTWGGISIFSSANVTNGKATINLSNAKINKLVTASSQTQNIVITLSNGYVIKDGYKLTIIKAN